MPAGFEPVELTGKLGSMRTPETHAHEVAAALGPRQVISRPLGQAQEMRHLGAQLGLTPAGMLALGWVVRSE